MTTLKIIKCPYCFRHHPQVLDVWLCDITEHHWVLYREGRGGELLSGQQGRLLQLLMARHGKSVSKDEFIEHLWPDPDLEPDWSRKQIDVYIYTIRAKLQRLGLWITNTYGFGWELKELAPRESTSRIAAPVDGLRDSV